MQLNKSGRNIMTNHNTKSTNPSGLFPRSLSPESIEDMDTINL